MPTHCLPTHRQRVDGLAYAFLGAHDRLIALLQPLPDELAARRGRDGAWTPAQIGCHVALTNVRLAKVLTEGDTVDAPDDFADDWSRLTIPARVEAPASLDPPVSTTRAAAIDQLQASRETMVRAIRGLTPERGVRCMASRFGVMSVYQMGEFVTRHVERHIGQAQRTIALLMTDGPQVPS